MDKLTREMNDLRDRVAALEVAMHMQARMILRLATHWRLMKPSHLRTWHDIGRPPITR